MSYQNFFASADNGRRQTPAQTSGVSVSSEFRCRRSGSSQQVVSVTGVEDNNKRLFTHVEVRDPNTGKLVFDDIFVTDK
jgi:hypothetical protein